MSSPNSLVVKLYNEIEKSVGGNVVGWDKLNTIPYSSPIILIKKKDWGGGFV